MRRLAGTILLFLALGTPAAAFPVDVHDSAFRDALAWFEARARSDGCIAPQPTGACSHASTRDVVLALSAAGVDPHGWAPAGISPVDYLQQHPEEIEAEPGDCVACKWAKMIVVLAAIGEDPRSFAGRDYVAKLDAHFDGVQVGSPGQVNDDAWALFAYAAIDDPPQAKVDAIRTFLLARQNGLDDGWSWNLAARSDAWATSTVLLALRGTGSEPTQPPIADAIAFLHSQQLESGLMAQDGSGSSESTSISVQALRALGEDPAGANWTESRNLVDALLSLQMDDGSFRHNEQVHSPFLPTTQALPALRGIPYPFRPPSVAIVVETANATAGSPVTLRGHATDADGVVTDYRWNFDDGSGATGPNAEHAFAAAGPHDVVLEAMDDDGVVRTASVALAVGPADATETTPTLASIDSTSSGSPDKGAPRAAGTDDSAPLPGIGAVLTLACCVLAVLVLRRK